MPAGQCKSPTCVRSFCVKKMAGLICNIAMMAIFGSQSILRYRVKRQLLFEGNQVLMQRKQRGVEVNDEEALMFQQFMTSLGLLDEVRFVVFGTLIFCASLNLVVCAFVLGRNEVTCAACMFVPWFLDRLRAVCFEHRQYIHAVSILQPPLAGRAGGEG